MSEPVVLGVDRYARGWIEALVDASGSVTFRVDRSLDALVEDANAAVCVAVDMPIGLLSRGLERQTSRRVRSSAHVGAACS